MEQLTRATFLNALQSQPSTNQCTVHITNLMQVYTTKYYIKHIWVVVLTVLWYVLQMVYCIATISKWNPSPRYSLNSIPEIDWATQASSANLNLLCFRCLNFWLWNVSNPVWLVNHSSCWSPNPCEAREAIHVFYKSKEPIVDLSWFVSIDHIYY